MLQSQQPMPVEQPSESVAFKDLPMTGKIQFAAKLGITLKPEDFQDANSQQDNQLKQQELQLKAHGQQTDAQLQVAKIEADKQKTGAQMQHTQEMSQNNNAHSLLSAAVLAEQSHNHNMQHSLVTSAVGHEQGKETSQMSHGQQMQRDKQNNKVKQVGKK